MVTYCLRNAPMLHRICHVGNGRGAWTMTHEQHRFARTIVGKRAQHRSLVERVEVARRLIEQNERSIVQEHARKAQSLALATRKGIAELAHLRTQQEACARNRQSKPFRTPL